MQEILRHGSNFAALLPVIAGRFICAKCGCEYLADQKDMELSNFYSRGEVVERVVVSACPECGEKNDPVQTATLRACGWTVEPPSAEAKAREALDDGND